MSGWIWMLAVSYLVGGVPWSFLAARLVGGVDLRRVGSGNLGATNTFRALGARVAVPVLLLDVLKGLAAPLVFAPLVDPGPLAPATLATLCGAAAILGHMFSPYMGFRGGKGVATSAGVLAALEPLAFAVCLVVFVLVFAASGGIVSIGSLLASLVLPFAVYAVARWQGESDWTQLWFVSALVLLVWIKHAPNIVRLARGEERRLLARRDDVKR